MKKFKLLLSLSILFFALYSCDQQSEFDSLESIDSKKPITKSFETLARGADINYCGAPVECTLVAGQSIDAGTVTVNNSETHLYVKIYSKAGFQDVDENIKMWVGKDLPDKRPPAGKFPYKVTESGNTYTFEIKLSTLEGWDDEGGCDQHFYIIVHADVLTVAGDDSSGETAFGGCYEGDGNAWWYYMEYTTGCCDDAECMDVMAKKYTHSTCQTLIDDEGSSHLFWSNQLNFKLWNVFHPIEGYDIPIYANINESCNSGENPGFFIIGYVNLKGSVEKEEEGETKLFTTVKYSIDEKYITQYSFSEINLYIGEDEFPYDSNGNPIQDPLKDNMFYQEQGNGMTEYTFIDLHWPGNLDAFDTYVIAKAKVCKRVE